MSNLAALKASQGRSFIGPLLVCAAGAGLSFALFSYVRDYIDRDAKLRFERQAADARHIIERRLQAYVGVTYGLRALFAAREQPNRAEFHRYVESLNLKDNYPGFEVLNYARHVRGDQRREFEQSVRRDTSVDASRHARFSVKPPGERPEYHVLVYLAPMNGNEFALGLDIASTPVRAKAIHLIRDTGELISSGRIVNVKGA